MKKITKLLTFSLFMLAGSVPFVTAHGNQSTCSSSYDSDDSSSCDYDGSYDQDNIAICRAIVATDIQDLKNLIIPGQELTAIKLLAPDIDLDNYDIQGYTFIHLFTELLDIENVGRFQSLFSKTEMQTYQAKLIELMKHAVSVGIDIDAQDNNTKTALMIAADGNYKIEIVQLLIDLGANLEIKNENGYTALIIAVENHVEILCEVAVLMTFGEQDSSDYSETENYIASSIEIIQLLVHSGADVFAQDKDDDTILAYLDRTIDEVDEAFEYFNFDKEMQSISIWGFEIDLCSTNDFHKALVKLKQDLEAIKQVIEKSITL